MESLRTQLDQLENTQLVRRLPEEELTYLFKHALTFCFFQMLILSLNYADGIVTLQGSPRRTHLARHCKETGVTRMSRRKSQPSMRSSANYYLAKPKSGKGGQVLVLHAWWGLNEFIKEFCDRLAKEGFVALAPDLYHGAVASTIEQAEKLSSKLKQDVAAKEITQAVEQLQAIGVTNTRGIGVIGFSLGGYWALWLADHKPNPVVATVVFYATRNDDYAQSHSAFQFHLAETDDYEPTSEVKKLQNSLSAAGKPAEFYSYAGTTHWFFESDRTDAYHAESAKLAWNRTVAFLKAHIKEA